MYFIFERILGRMIFYDIISSLLPLIHWSIKYLTRLHLAVTYLHLTGTLPRSSNCEVLLLLAGASHSPVLRLFFLLLARCSFILWKIGTLSSPFISPTTVLPRKSLLILLLYVQEVVTLQKKIFNIFASENEVYTIGYYDTRLNIIRLQSEIILGHMNLIG